MITLRYHDHTPHHIGEKIQGKHHIGKDSERDQKSTLSIFNTWTHIAKERVDHFQKRLQLNQHVGHTYKLSAIVCAGEPNSH
jgi:hypothetical protein